MRSLLRAALLLLLAEYSGYAQCSPICGTGGVPPGFQAIVLGAPFKYYGNITAINATMYVKTASFAHAIILQIWRPVVNQSAFTLTASQYFFADPSVTQVTTELQFPSAFKNQPFIQLSFIPNDVLGYYVITDTTNQGLGFADSLSPYIVNSSEPSSINVHTTNSTRPLQFFNTSGPPSFPNAHPLITIAYTTTSSSPRVGGNSTITILGACPQTTSAISPTYTTSSSSLVYQALLTLVTTSAPSSSFLSSSPTISTHPSLPSPTAAPPTSFPIAISAIVGCVPCIILLIGIVLVLMCVMRRRHVKRTRGKDDIPMTSSSQQKSGTDGSVHVPLPVDQHQPHTHGTGHCTLETCLQSSNSSLTSSPATHSEWIQDFSMRSKMNDYENDLP